VELVFQEETMTQPYHCIDPGTSMDCKGRQWLRYAATLVAPVPGRSAGND
jgi:hypothetical protein